MKTFVTVYWLIPAKAERELFRELIRILAREFAAPRFEPHLTLCVGQDRQRARKVLRQTRTVPIRLRVSKIACSSKFTKTLFVRFKSERSLEKLIVDLGGHPPRDPHVSLLYKKMSILTAKELARTIKLPFAEVVFDSIKVARCISPTETRADVEKWRVIATKKLSG